MVVAILGCITNNIIIVGVCKGCMSFEPNVIVSLMSGFSSLVVMNLAELSNLGFSIPCIQFLIANSSYHSHYYFLSSLVSLSFISSGLQRARLSPLPYSWSSYYFAFFNLAGVSMSFALVGRGLPSISIRMFLVLIKKMCKFLLLL